MLIDFKDKVAFITGSAQGIGEAVAQLYAKYGAAVVLADLNLEKTAQLAESISSSGGRALAVRIDVSDEESVQAAIKQAVIAFDHIDFLINCAGMLIPDKLLDIRASDWDKVLSIDLTGSFLVGQAAAREMAKRHYGKIVFISSVAAQDAEVGLASYCTAKAGVNMLTLCMAKELAEYGINVNSVNPASINTKLQQDYLAEMAEKQGVTEDAFRKEYFSIFPIGRMGEPDEVAQLCACLCADELAFIDGENVLISGAKVLRM